MSTDIYRIVDRDTNEEVGVYMQPTARDEYNFSSVEDARRSNCHGIYEDKAKYKIRKYKLVLVDDDCDPATEEDFKRAAEEKELKEKRKGLVKQYTKELALKRYGVEYDELDDFNKAMVGMEAEMKVIVEKYCDAAILG